MSSAQNVKRAFSAGIDNNPIALQVLVYVLRLQ